MSEPDVPKALELIFAFLDRPGESQASFARRCEMSRPAVCRIVARVRLPDFDSARKIRDGIGVPLDAWFEPASKSFQRRFIADAA